MILVVDRSEDDMLSRGRLAVKVTAVYNMLASGGTKSRCTKSKAL